ncbi:MAG: hypothetical protein K1060chlam4_00229 [Candidatus Anoxychlamydiales bacterium]|nr:hypothetical protein [Candidatus Anoxychlamydiales bacterium]
MHTRRSSQWKEEKFSLEVEALQNNREGGRVRGQDMGLFRTGIIFKNNL